VANNAFTKLKKLGEAAHAFFHERGIERQDATRQPRLLCIAHFWLLVGKSFTRNRCPVRASALAFSTLLALIPMLAVVFGIATSILKGQGEAPARMLVDKLVSAIAPLPEDGQATEARKLAEANRDEAVQKITEFISKAQSGAVGITGMIALVVVALTMLMRIEATFNDIWGVTRGRSWYTQIILYWAVISLGPLLLITALALTGGGQFHQTKQWLEQLPFVGSLTLKFLLKFLPFAVLTVMFAMFYQLMPNTRVRPQASIAGGLVAGLLWQVNSWLGVLFISRVTSNNAIYGSVGMIPVIMIGLYFGWLILLFGAQVAYAFQNRAAYLSEKQAESVNQRGRELTALRIMAAAGRRFEEGRPAPSVNQFADTLGVPTKLVSQLLQVLMRAGLVVETHDRECGYTPARPLNQITAHDVLHAFRAGHGQDFAERERAADLPVLNEFDRICQAEHSVAGSVTLHDLVAQTKGAA
jgi:membrane protein